MRELRVERIKDKDETVWKRRKGFGENTETCRI